ncbi:MAG: endolytic transglycosylase MltG [Beijerinckiaceae bacterium]|nr:endolytic transglycosylase MltG [Beijerinckiaceae bacterium]
MSGFLSFLLVMAIASVSVVVWSQHRMRQPGPLATNKVVYIAPGTEVPEIIAELVSSGVIDSPFLLNISLLLEGNRSKVKAGEYLFKQNANLREVIDTLVSGKQVLHAITIPEGLTSENIVERLRGNELLVGDIMDMPKEGSLLPETYKVARGAVRADVIKKMQDDQRRAVDQIWARRASNLSLRSPYELITLASIVEKETGKADERTRVAGVFLNRLKKGMRLQSDPTIVYGIAGGKGALGRGITRTELEKATPYNTYLIDGLPPGPIANPGRAALEAVANPSRTQELYFVADGTGGHVFSETLDQHSRNVQRWRQIERDTKDIQEEVTPDLGETAPQAPPPPAQTGGGRKSERHKSTSVYGALPAWIDVSPSGSAALPAASPAAAAAAIAGAMPATAPDEKVRAAHAGAKSAAKISAYTFGPGLDELGISLNGVLTSAAAIDGPAGEESTAEDSGRDGNFLVPGGPLAGQKTDTPQPGLAPVPNDLSDTSLGRDNSRAPQRQDVRRPMSARAFDASKGTARDPLRNTTYDLNYAKIVPAM